MLLCWMTAVACLKTVATVNRIVLVMWFSQSQWKKLACWFECQMSSPIHRKQSNPWAVVTNFLHGATTARQHALFYTAVCAQKRLDLIGSFMAWKKSIQNYLCLLVSDDCLLVCCFLLFPIICWLWWLINFLQIHFVFSKPMPNVTANCFAFLLIQTVVSGTVFDMWYLACDIINMTSAEHRQWCICSYFYVLML